MSAEALRFDEDAQMPNNPLPVLLHRGALRGASETEHRERFARHGWGGSWTDGIFDFHHFHSNAHEVLGIVSGSVTVQLGGESGRAVELEAGDVVVLPAGTGHKRLSSQEVVVVGAYPTGQEDYDLCRSKAERPQWRERIASVALPEHDPVEGDGPPSGWQTPSTP